jgi:hypothetical protein
VPSFSLSLFKYYYNNTDVSRSMEGPAVRGYKFQEYVNNVLYQGVEFTAFRLGDNVDPPFV